MWFYSHRQSCDIVRQSIRTSLAGVKAGLLLIAREPDHTKSVRTSKKYLGRGDEPRDRGSLPYTVGIDDASKVRFSATLAQEPEVELALV